MPQTATLTNFNYTDGVSELRNPAHCPYIRALIKSVNSYNLVKGKKPLDFYRS